MWTARAGISVRPSAPSVRWQRILISETEVCSTTQQHAGGLMMKSRISSYTKIGPSFSTNQPQKYLKYKDCIL
jgi:hypothetical protein